MGYRHSVNDIAATCLQEAISEAKATDLYHIKGGAVSFTVLFWVDIIMIPSHSTSFFPCDNRLQARLHLQCLSFHSCHDILWVS